MKVITLEPAVAAEVFNFGKPWGFVVLRWLSYVTLAQGVYDEAYFAWLRLPSWGFEYDFCNAGYRWCQRVLCFHGFQGFSIRHRFIGTEIYTE
jgi:hypothetical protein